MLENIRAFGSRRPGQKITSLGDVGCNDLGRAEIEIVFDFQSRNLYAECFLALCEFVTHIRDIRSISVLKSAE